MNKIDHESAQVEFLDMCAHLDLDLDIKGEDLESFNALKAKIVKAIERGDLIIDGGRPTYTPKGGDPLAFKEATGTTLMAVDKVKDGEDVRKTYVLITELTGGKFKPGKCTPRDIGVLTAIMSLFLAD